MTQQPVFDRSPQARSEARSRDSQGSDVRTRTSTSTSDMADFIGVPVESVDQAELAKQLTQGWSRDIPIGSGEGRR